MGNGWHCMGMYGRSCSGYEGCDCDCGHCLREQGLIDWDAPICRDSNGEGCQRPIEKCECEKNRG